MEDKIVIAIICGTSREGRESIKAAKWVADFAGKLPGVEAVLVDPKDVHLPPDGAPADGRDPSYSDITARADAFYIVTPEYNHSMPGSLKRLLDSEYDNYKHKAVGIAGVSNGPWGGVRVCEALLPVCHRVGLVNIQPEMYFPQVQHLFDDNGQLKPEHIERYTKNAQMVFGELIWMAKALKAARG
jgi:NAD(P)H-dependent FMN reductase